MATFSAQIGELISPSVDTAIGKHVTYFGPVKQARVVASSKSGGKNYASLGATSD